MHTMLKVWRQALLLLALLALLAAPPARAADERKQVKKRRRRGKGMRITDPKQAYGWSYYRYTRYDKEPHQQDKYASILAGGDVKCDVCEVIFAKALQDLAAAKQITGGVRDQENIEEHLEADQVDPEKVEKAPTQMEKYVEKYKKGCNKLFKESFLQLGWDVVACHKQLPFDMPDQPLDGRIPWACARDMHEPPKDMNTYKVERESIHYACEATITRHREELAKYVAENYEEFKKRPLKMFVKEACRKAAKCEVRKPTENMEARARKMVSFASEKNDELDDKLKEVKKDLRKAKKIKKNRRKGSDDSVEL